MFRYKTIRQINKKDWHNTVTDCMSYLVVSVAVYRIIP